MTGKQTETMIGGPRGPAPGKTKSQKQAEMAAAEKAAEARAILLDTVVDKLKEVDADKLSFIQKDILALIHNALDRGWGKAQTSVDITSSDGSASLPNAIRLVGPDDDNS